MTSHILYHPGILLAVCCFVFGTDAMSSDNSTITLPPGISNHGHPNLICSVTRWTDVVVFFSGNYLAHIATVRARAGGSWLDSAWESLAALLVPILGAKRGLGALFSMAHFAKSDLQTAARAGALCQVVHIDVDENDPDEPQHAKFYLNQPWIPASIYGCLKLPPGYGLAILPADARFEDDGDCSNGRPPFKIACNCSAMKILVFIAQLAFATSTLYRARGDQISRYGYAAFGLTVAPYATMSLLNLLGSLVCPEYSTLYLVESRAADEARRYPGTVIEGTVGRLVESHGHERRRRPERFSQHFARWWTKWEADIRVPLALTPTLISILVTWLLSRYRPGRSSSLQQLAVVEWNIGNGIMGFCGFGEPEGSNKVFPRRTLYYTVVQVVIGGAPTIGIFVMVGMMLREYGVCTIIHG